MFLEIAGRSGVCLVTGNQQHFPFALCQDAVVLSPVKLLSTYRQRQELENHP